MLFPILATLSARRDENNPGNHTTQKVRHQITLWLVFYLHRNLLQHGHLTDTHIIKLIRMAEDDGETHSENDVFSVNNVDASSAVAKNSSSLISYRQHLVDVTKITYPIILSEIFQNTLPVMDIVFVGHLGKQDLAAAALATVWFNLWNATMMGFMTAIDTLLAQSFGAKQYKHVGVWTGSSLIIIFLTTLVVSGMVALCGPAMHLFGQDPQLADAAGEFAIRLIPGLFPYYLFKVLTKFLQTQNKTAPGVWIGILANAMNALFNWGLIFVAGWGINVSDKERILWFICFRV